MLQFSDNHHPPRQKNSDHEDFERSVFGYERSSTETYTANVRKKRELFQHYEKALHGDSLPLCSDTLPLTKQAAQKVVNWLASASD